MHSLYITYLNKPELICLHTGTTTPGQSRPGSNGNDGVLHIPKSLKPGAWPSDSLVSYQGHIGWGIFYSPRQLRY